MEMLVLCKLQLVCFAITIYIAVLYFSSKRINSKLQKSFEHILILLPLYLISDIATVITVNNIEKFGIINDICHRIFFIMIILLVYSFCNHMHYVIEEEEGESNHKKILFLINNVILVVAILCSLLVKPSYEFGNITGYSSIRFGGGPYAAAAIYILMIAILYFTHWKILPGKKRLAIGTTLCIELIGVILQLKYTELLLSGSMLTLMMINFYLTLENPDAKLLQEVAKEKEKADAANASKSAFLSVVSHEIRTPMNAIVGMTELLLREKDNLNSKQEKYLLNIKNSGASLVMIVNDILDQSKIEAGKMEIVPDKYELRPMVSDVKMIIENRIGNKPIHLILDIDEDIPSHLVGDSLRIRQVLINLMNNAVKFTDEGYIQLIIKIVEKNKEAILLKFVVKDSGMGIKQEELGKLGEAFSQVDIKKNHSKEGTGLGLSISRDFISLMGGQLEVDSVYGKGTEFFFTIEQMLTSNEEKISELSPELKATNQFTAPDAKILVVDDTDVNLTIMESFMESLEIKVDTADSGIKALELVKQSKYDLIYMDYIMPYMDGIEATKQIRAHSSDCAPEDIEYYQSVPIIAMSGDTATETTENFKLAGIDDFAEKPVNVDELYKQLIKWIPKEKIHTS